MEGVVFEVWDKDGNLVDTMTTDADGKAMTKVLPYGKYTLVETKTMTGYILSDKSTFSILQAPKDGEAYSTVEMTIANQKMGKVEVYKVTADGTSTPMNGVVFGVYNAKTDKEIARITTDKNGYGFVYVLAGNYYLKEISTWQGYSVSPDKIAVTGVANGVVYTFREKNDTTTTKIQKTNTAGTTLAGMHFTVTDAETGKLVEMFYDQSRAAYLALVSDKIKAPQNAVIVTEGVTGADGTTQVLGLLAGHSYVFSEIVAPDGYNNDSKPVTITIGTSSDVLGTARFVDSLITVKTGETSSPLLPMLGVGFAGVALIMAAVLIYKKRHA
jgi:LPXTG-motif cell wall-anchored protein